LSNGRNGWNVDERNHLKAGLTQFEAETRALISELKSLLRNKEQADEWPWDLKAEYDRLAEEVQLFKQILG